jgi:formylglycine-generating enzyme required for sulfatase activity
LASEAQFAFFGADADKLGAVGQISSVGRPSKRTNPEKVGSTTPNIYRIYDVVGNVWEWVATEGVYYGGSYTISASYKLGIKVRENNRALDPTIGFRVILVP